MCENRFRIWDNINNEYLEEPYYRWLISREGHIYNTENDQWYNPNDKRFTIEWFTGRLDKNGVEIFEGDIAVLRSILSIGDDEYTDGIDIDQLYTGVVVFVPSKGFVIKVEGITDNHSGEQIIFSRGMAKNIVSYRTVLIGNIHEKEAKND